MRRLLARLAPRPGGPTDLGAASVAVGIRWFGLAVGFLYANAWAAAGDVRPLNGMLSLGLLFTALDTAAYLRRRVFLRDATLLIAAMEALFIGLLCETESGPDSPFRFYYLLSLICCAMRSGRGATVAAFALHAASYALVFLAAPPAERDGVRFLVHLVTMGWVAWAAGAMAHLLRRAGDETRLLNERLQENQRLLETRIAQRSRELEESQAQVIHQEKMAAFGLLAAGIAHEVGNPLAGISNLVQLLERRDLDPYTRERLGMVTSQLSRIQGILRELVTFSRPASGERGRVAVRDVVDEALGIAKFYKGGKSRQISADVPADLPALTGVRDQLVQVVFNLVLNAIDATGKGGRVAVAAALDAGRVRLTVSDDGCGIDPVARERLFRPYFTTKKHGTGLGLFVTRRIVEEHGGAVDVGENPGGGTVFTISLPAAVAPVLGGAVGFRESEGVIRGAV